MCTEYIKNGKIINTDNGANGEKMAMLPAGLYSYADLMHVMKMLDIAKDHAINFKQEIENVNKQHS